jgi:hypothetical protein
MVDYDKFSGFVGEMGVFTVLFNIQALYNLRTIS